MTCPHCGKAPYPWKNEDGTINWKNLFRIDFMSVMLVISIILIILGVKQINEQCYKILEEPCKVIDQYGCTGETQQYGKLPNLTLSMPVT